MERLELVPADSSRLSLTIFHFSLFVFHLSVTMIAHLADVTGTGNLNALGLAPEMSKAGDRRWQDTIHVRLR
jgi:hypothetical protein